MSYNSPYSGAEVDDAVDKRHTQNTDTKLDEGGANETTAQEAREHIDATDNPHGVTKSQVGLADVDNVSAADLRDRSTHTGTQTLSTISDAGTIATQDANSVNIDGGSIDGTAIGVSSADEGNFTTLDASGDVTIADKIVHAGDTNTAIRFPSADTVTFETAGNERMRIDSSGNVGIGTSAPSFPLEVSGDTSISGNLRLGNPNTQKRAYRFSVQNANNNGVNIPTAVASSYDIWVVFDTSINASNCVLTRKFLVTRPNNESTGRLDEYATGATSTGFTGSLTANYNSSTGNIEIRVTAGSITTTSRINILIEAFSTTSLPDLSTFTY